MASPVTAAGARLHLSCECPRWGPRVGVRPGSPGGGQHLGPLGSARMPASPRGGGREGGVVVRNPPKRLGPHRKRPSAAEGAPPEGESSPPPGARRRFSALLEPGRPGAPPEERPPPRNGAPPRDGPTDGPSEDPGQSRTSGTLVRGGGSWTLGSLVGGPRHLSPHQSVPPGERAPRAGDLPPPRAELGLRRPRHPGVAPEAGGDKRSPRGPGKVTKSASATALSVIIPSGGCHPRDPIPPPGTPPHPLRPLPPPQLGGQPGHLGPHGWCWSLGCLGPKGWGGGRDPLDTWVPRVGDP